jgi:RHS repeat-associated protein
VHDAMGNVHGMVSTSMVTGSGGTTYAVGSLVASYEYDAFGKTLREEGPYAAANPFRYSTKYTDNETGLVYYGMRYYAPSLGRFINRDPIAEQGGLNLYGFVGNDGVNRWDYLGMWGSVGSEDEKNMLPTFTVYANPPKAGFTNNWSSFAGLFSDRMLGQLPRLAPRSETYETYLWVLQKSGNTPATKKEIFVLPTFTVRADTDLTISWNLNGSSFRLPNPDSMFFFHVKGSNDREYEIWKKRKAYRECKAKAFNQDSAKRSSSVKNFHQQLEGLRESSDAQLDQALSELGGSAAEGTAAASAATVGGYYLGAYAITYFGFTGTQAIIIEGTAGFVTGQAATRFAARSGPEGRSDIFMGDMMGAIDTPTNPAGVFGYTYNLVDTSAEAIGAAHGNLERFNEALKYTVKAYGNTKNHLDRQLYAAIGECDKLLR